MNCSSVNSQFTEQYRLSVCTFLSTWHVIENHRSVILHRCGYWFAVLSVNDFEQFSCRTSILPQSLVAYAFEIFTGHKHRLIKLFLFVTVDSIYIYCLYVLQGRRPCCSSHDEWTLVFVFHTYWLLVSYHNTSPSLKSNKFLFAILGAIFLTLSTSRMHVTSGYHNHYLDLHHCRFVTWRTTP